MRIYDNRITQTDAARRLKHMAKLGYRAVAGVELETTLHYTQYLKVVTLILDSSDDPVEVYSLKRSGRTEKGYLPWSYMPMQTPGIRATSTDVLTLDVEAVLGTYKRWQRARYLVDHPGGEKDWERMEKKEQDGIRRHWERSGPAS